MNEQVKKGSFFKNFLKKIYERFIKIRGTPRDVALGASIGLFISMTPTMGIQMYIALPIAALFGVSKVAAVIAVWLTNPLTAPFLYGFNYMIGARILGYPFTVEVILNPNYATLMDSGWRIFLSLLVGGTITGIILGIAGYFFVEGMIKTARERAEKLKNIKNKIPSKLKIKKKSTISKLD